jgi:hypothetical protein
MRPIGCSKPTTTANPGRSANKGIHEIAYSESVVRVWGRLVVCWRVFGRNDGRRSVVRFVFVIGETSCFELIGELPEIVDTLNAMPILFLVAAEQ